MNEPNIYVKKAVEIAEIVSAKQSAYGNSFGLSGEILRVLYANSNGIPLEKMDDALTVIRILDKLFRIANQKTAFGESPYTDIAGYALLAAVRDKEGDKEE